MNLEYETINRNDGNWKIFFRQIALNSVSSIFDILIGVGTGAPTVIIPQLRKAVNSTEPISNEMASWASSVNQFCGIPWVIILITMAHYIGRKKTMVFLNLSLFLIFTSIYFSSNIKWVIVNQALFGIGNASMKTLLIMIVTEFSSPKYRGVFLTFKVASFFWGVWISNALGTYLHYSSIGLFGIVCSIYIFLALIKVPESPYWLAKNEKYAECALSHRWLKGHGEDAERELEMLIDSQKECKKTLKSTTNMSCQEIRSLAKPDVYKPILCCILLQLLYDFSGKLIMTIYAIDIYKKISGNEQNAYSSMLIIDGVTVFAMYVASGLTKIMTRRRLLLTASLAVLFLLALFSLYMFLIRYSILTENIYVAISILIVYSIFVCCGPIVLAAVIIAELLPVKNSISVIIVALCIKITMGSSLKVSPTLFRYLGNDGTFLVFGVGFSIALFLVYKYIPETKDKTLQEISDYFKPKSTISNEQKELVCMKRDSIEID